MGTNETLNRAGILSIARRPEWKTPASLDIPDNVAAGVSIAGSVKTMVDIKLREEIHRRTARIEITYDGSTTYEVTVDGTQVDTAGTTDLPTTLAAIANDINTDATVSDLVVATVEDSKVVLRGIGQEDYTLAVSVTGGAGTISATADATTAEVYVHLYADGTGDVPEGWSLARDGHFTEVTYRGLIERIDTAGCARCAIEVVADGEVASMRIGPGVLE